MQSDSFIERVKRLKPSSLRVTLSDGTVQAVPVPKAGNRWARTQQTIDSLNWSTVECLDKDGRLLGPIVENEDGDEATFSDGESASSLAKVMLDVVKTTLKEARAMFDVQLRGQAELVAAMVEGMRHVTESYQTAIRVQATLAAAPVAGEGTEVMDMLKMAFMLQQQPRMPSGPPARPQNPPTAQQRKE